MLRYVVMLCVMLYSVKAQLWEGTAAPFFIDIEPDNPLNLRFPKKIPFLVELRGLQRLLRI